MSDLAVRQQLFSLFSAAFRKEGGGESERPGIAARPFTLGSHMAGIFPSARPAISDFQRSQQLAHRALAVGFARPARVVPRERHVPAT